MHQKPNVARENDSIEKEASFISPLLSDALIFSVTYANLSTFAIHKRFLCSLLGVNLLYDLSMKSKVLGSQPLHALQG